MFVLKVKMLSRCLSGAVLLQGLWHICLFIIIMFILKLCYGEHLGILVTYLRHTVFAPNGLSLDIANFALKSVLNTDVNLIKN